MTISKKVLPYEFLVRWDEITGAIKGHHFLSIAVVSDDASGEVYSSTPSPAMSASAAIAAGFPLDAIISAVTADALASLDSERAAHESEKEAHRATQAAFALESERAANAAKDAVS